jgi:hypothetical protein
MLTSYDGAKGTSPSKINGNGRWERKIVSLCIGGCDKFTFISGYLLHPNKDKSLEMLAVTTGLTSYIEIKKVDG